MATYIENLQTARDNIAAALADMTANPKPSYSIDGQSVSWNEFYKALTDQLKATNDLLAGADPQEIVTEAWP